MRKRIMAAITTLLLICIMLMQVVQAAEPRVAGTYVDLSFDGNIAICSALCRGSSASDKIEATLTLYQGNTFVDSWSESGNYSVAVSGEHKVTSGKSYRLELTYSINGVEKPTVSTTSTCP